SVFYVANANGSNARISAKLSDTDALLPPGFEPRQSVAQQLVWSPDGKSLGFVRTFRQAGTTGGDGLYAVPATGGIAFQIQLDSNWLLASIDSFDWRGPGSGFVVVPCVTGLIPNPIFCVQSVGGLYLGGETIYPTDPRPGVRSP